MHQPGEVVAGFRIERLLGSGGMGEVYLVHHPRLPRFDALKLLPAAASADHSYRERFQREADLAARLDHDNVVTVYDRGEADGQLWIHMKYVAGADAAASLRISGPFSEQRALHTVSRVASALDAAHRHGLLHRDVKPANILLGSPAGPGEPERVFLTDFGIAKGVGDAPGLTPSGHFAASLDYAAPEQIQRQAVDGRADQYALGCVLFQLLTGSVPYPGDGAWARMNAHLTAPVPRVGQLRPGLPLAVQSVLDRVMAKAPQDRYGSCGELAAALGSALRGVATDIFAVPIAVPFPVTPLPPSPAPREAALPAPRPPDKSETPPPHTAIHPPPHAAATRPAPPTPAPPTAPLPSSRPDPPTPAPATAPLPSPRPEPPQSTLSPPPVAPGVPSRLPVQWWRQVDRAAAGSLAAALALGLLSAFPPSSALSVSRYPGELGTGRFAAGELPTVLLLLVAAGLQLTRFGHRFRSLLYGVAAGAGVYAAVDSVRVYSFTQGNPGGAYDSALAQTNGALPRAAVALVVALAASWGVLTTPAQPKPRPGPHLLIAALLAAVAVMLTIVAIVIGPAIQLSRLHELAYGVPLGSALASAVLLGLAALTRRTPLLGVSVTVSGCAFIAGLAAPDPLHYPLALVADVCLLAAAGVLLAASRRPAHLGFPPPPPPFHPPPADAAFRPAAAP